MQMKILLVLMILWGLTIEGNAQPDSLWSVTYGAEDTLTDTWCSQVIETSDGCYVMAGYINRDAGEHWYSGNIVKVSDEGEILWARELTDEIMFAPSAIIETNDSGFALAGRQLSFGPSWIFKTNSEGETIWSLSLEADQALDIIQTRDGGYLVAGSENFSPNLIKTDEEGEIQWSQEYEIPARPRSIVQNDQGGFAIACSDGPNQSYVLFTDENGDSTGLLTFPDIESFSIKSITLLPDEGYFISGRIYHEYSPYTLWALTIDFDGEIISSQIFGPYQYQRYYYNTIIQTQDGGFVLGGDFRVEDRNFDFMLLKTDENGDSLWSGSFGNDQNEYSKSLIQNRNGEYLLAGRSVNYEHLEPDANFLLIKIGLDTLNTDYQESPISRGFLLDHAYPNPFNSTVNIAFDLPRPKRIKMSIIDDLGRELVTIVDGYYQEGRHHTYWDAESVPAGMYIAKMQVDKQNVFRKLMLVK